MIEPLEAGASLPLLGFASVAEGAFDDHQVSWKIDTLRESGCSAEHLDLLELEEVLHMT